MPNKKSVIAWAVVDKDGDYFEYGFVRKSNDRRMMIFVEKEDANKFGYSRLNEKLVQVKITPTTPLKD